MINDSDLPIIGASRITVEDKGEHTRIEKSGRLNLVFFPEVYVQFVSLLNREHPDLIAAMQLAQCKMEDGSAVGFLARVMEIDDSDFKNLPMEVGYSILYEALKKRTGSRILEGLVREEAESIIHEKLTTGAYRKEEDVGTALFPDADAMFDKAKWNDRQSDKVKDRDRNRKDWETK